MDREWVLVVDRSCPMVRTSTRDLKTRRCAGWVRPWSFEPARGLRAMSHQGCHLDTAAGVAGDRLPASAYDSWLAARITALACFSSFGLVRRELGPEMHIEPSSRQFRPNTGAATLATSGSRSPSEMWKPRSRIDSYGAPCAPLKARITRPGAPLSSGRRSPMRTLWRTDCGPS